MINERIEDLTEKILKKLNVISPKKIDLAIISKNLGVDIKGENLDPEISGFFVLKNGIPYIRFNKLEAIQRQRFTIAHELGHFLLHKDERPLFIDKSEKILYRDINSSTGEIKKEREANAFAASLLMPKYLLIESISSSLDGIESEIDTLAQLYNVSSQAMMFRLSNLGFITGG